MTRRMLIKGGPNWEANTLNPKNWGGVFVEMTYDHGHHIGYSVFVTEDGVARRKGYFALKDHLAETALRLACELRDELKGQKP
jgi:hypothetical protein